MGLYHDPDNGKLISTHSMLKTFRRCPKQCEYKYVQRLKPKKTGAPLKRGTWIHKLLEEDANGNDWREVHQQLSKEFNRLFDEEKDFYGDLPDEIFRLMQSYFWHYKNHKWKVLEVEFVLECELPDGSIFRCKIDLLVEDQFGLWIVDHKSHKTLPGLGYRILDAQSADYVYCALRNNIPVQGHIWNYLRWKPPTIPQLTKTGLVGRWDKMDTDYFTALKFFKANFPDGVPSRYVPKLKRLKAQQYVHGEVQQSTYFRRDVLEKSKVLLNQVAREMYHTHRRMNEYPFDRPEIVERNVERSCEWLCSYTDLCATELWGGNPVPLLKSKYLVGDPMDYYFDEKEMVDGRGD